MLLVLIVLALLGLLCLLPLLALLLVPVLLLFLLLDLLLLIVLALLGLLLVFLLRPLRVRMLPVILRSRLPVPGIHRSSRHRGLLIMLAYERIVRLIPVALTAQCTLPLNRRITLA